MEGLTAAEIAKRTAEYLELVGLGTFGDRLPAQMSGGQQQRVALARALAKRPAVLLLDEPLGALDLKLRKQMQSELARIHRQVGTTFVFVTHDQEEALSMASRIAIMADGKVVQLGTPREIYDHPVNRFVADFVGESNFIDGVISGAGDGAVFEAAGGAVDAPADTSAGPSTLMVRPEFLVLRTPGEETRTPGLPGRIVNVAFMGNHTRVTVATGAGDLVAIRPHGSGGPSTTEERALGEEVCVWWPGDRGALVSA
jgi:spermidine/putrescine transport system ATP-binding protein